METPEVSFGVGLVTAEVPPGSGRSPADEYADVLRVAERAEELGFRSLWTSEHHGVSDGYLPSQLVLLAAVAAVTDRLELGTGVLVAPVHEPLRLAEDAAVLDNLSRGRLTLGVGLGWRPEEYRMFGAAGERRVGRLTDLVRVLRLAFTGERFSYSGRTLSYEDVLVTPAPYRPGGPRLLLGGSAEAAIRRAGRLGDGFIRSRASDTAALTSDVRLALRAAAEAGRTPAEFELVVLQSVVLTDDRDPDRTSRITSALAYQLGMYAALHDGDDTPGHGFSARSVPPEKVAAAALRGDSAAVARQLAGLVAASAPSRSCQLVLRLNYPGMARDDTLRLMKLFAADVLPRVREQLDASPGRGDNARDNEAAAR